MRVGTGDSHSGITVPQGDVDGLMDMAQTFDGLSGAMERSGAQFGALPGELASWRGAASVNFASAAVQSRTAAEQAGRGFSIKARAARVYADELEDAQRAARNAIEDAREAERSIARAKELIEDAEQRLEAARETIALAEIEILSTGLTGPPSAGAMSAKARAEDDAEQATADIGRGRRLLERARDDLDQARRRGRRAQQSAEDAGSNAQSLILSAAPLAMPLTLGAAPTGIGGTPGSLVRSMPLFLPLDRLGGPGTPPGRPQTVFGRVPPLLPLGDLAPGPDGIPTLLQGGAGGLGSYSRAAGERNRALRRFHAGGLGSLGSPAFREYLLSPEARVQADRMSRYHDSELSKARAAGEDISKLKTAGKFLGPAGDALGAKANADQGMPWLENALRTGGSWGVGSVAAGLAGTACAPAGPVAAGGCGAGGAIIGGEFGDRSGGGCTTASIGPTRRGSSRRARRSTRRASSPSATRSEA
ncbi:MAG: hypothetical protein WKF49_07565 [Thermoleophilaceae bacterium]